MIHSRRMPLALLLVLALASMSFGQERPRRASGGARRSRPAPAKMTSPPRSATASKAAAALNSSQAHSLVRLPYRRNVVPTDVAQGEMDGADMDYADNDLYVETTVYGGAAAPYVMAGYSRRGMVRGIYRPRYSAYGWAPLRFNYSNYGPYASAGLGYGGFGSPYGFGSLGFPYPYAAGPLATTYSYGVYGYPYYSFYRPSLAYSWWGPPGMVGPSYFGYGGYGLPYGYYGYGGAFYW